MGMIYFEDLNAGDSWISPELTIDHDEMLAYARENDPEVTSLMATRSQ